MASSDKLVLSHNLSASQNSVGGRSSRLIRIFHQDSDLGVDGEHYSDPAAARLVILSVQCYRVWWLRNVIIPRPIGTFVFAEAINKSYHSMPHLILDVALKECIKQ